MVIEVPDTVEIPAPGGHDCSVIWLHGLGADGHDFEPIVPELGLPAGHGVRFIFPHAPERPVTINAGMRMRAWYDVRDPDLGREPDETGISESAARVVRLVERETARGIHTDRIVLAGFSQGGAIALHTGLRYPRRLAGIVALSAYLPLPDRLVAEMAGANRDTPIFQAQGEHDPILAPALARASFDRIAAVRSAPEWHSYPIQHGVCAAEIDDLSRWLTAPVGVG